MGTDGSVAIPRPPAGAAARRQAARSAPSATSADRVAITVYLATRVLLLVVAFVNGTLRHHAFTHELAKWDGLWYRGLADHGYPDHVLTARRTRTCSRRSASSRCTRW